MLPRTLYITNELPYFPGQGGLMSQKVRYLACQQFTGVVGPRYPQQPEDALQQLRGMVDRSYWWPEPAALGDFLVVPDLWTQRTDWLKHLPKGIKQWVWRRLTNLDRYSDDALPWRVLITQLAPKILEALSEERWNSVLMAQSTSVVWLPFLPASLARCIYFHDIRSDYLRRSTNRPSRSNLRRIEAEEHIASHQVDAMAVVSELDRLRAEKFLRPTCPNAVSPISLDLDYFAFQPAKAAVAPIVLFTGHLSHPPNIDAALYFLAEIWPRVLAAMPQARFQIVGIQPAPAIIAAIAQSRQVELFPHVPDIRPYFHEASVYVVPMRFGGGVRQKILEAWAVGIPVVTTTMGAEGIAAVDGVHGWLRDDPAAFADQVCGLLHKPAPVAVLQAARKFVETNHSLLAACPSLTGQVNVAIERKNQSPPRVLYDLRKRAPGQTGEGESVTEELVHELTSFDRTYEYRFFGPHQVCRNLQFKRGFRRKVICSDGLQARWMSWRNAATNALTTDLALPSLTSPELSALEWYTRLDFTVVHGLSGFVHPDLRQFPSVVTINDLQHIHRPEDFSATDRSQREKDQRESCQLASHVICASEFTREDVHRHYGVPLEKITTIWPLPPQRAEAPLDSSLSQRLLRRMGIKPPFLFYDGEPLPHKNHRGLLEAMRIAGASLPDDYKLVLTGSPLPANHPAAALLLDPQLHHRVIFLGKCSLLEIAALYRGAAALIFPSLFEGSALPLIAAMQQNCPIVCGHHSCLPEAVGESALFADVASPQALSEAILLITRDASLCAKLRLSGTANLRRYNRRALAEKTRAIYASVHESHFT